MKQIFTIIRDYISIFICNFNYIMTRSTCSFIQRYFLLSSNIETSAVTQLHFAKCNCVTTLGIYSSVIYEEADPVEYKKKCIL